MKKTIKMKMFNEMSPEELESIGGGLGYIRLCIKHRLKQFFNPKHHYDTGNGKCTWNPQEGEPKDCPICKWIEEYNAL